MRTTKTIIIRFEHPPIPSRGNDYRAYFEGEEEANFCGWGCTPIIALAELMSMEEERAA